MSVERLAAALRESVRNAPDGEIVMSIHLFGIDHADELDRVRIADVIAAAGLRASYATELRKGMNLAAYVMRRPDAERPTT